MNIKTFLKKSQALTTIHGTIHQWICCGATMISPKLNTIIRFRETYGRSPDLENPKTLNEKVLWLKLNRYMNDPLVIKCADKYKVREYVKEAGYEHLLNSLIGVYDAPEEIPWDELPDRFVIKWNFGVGFNVICRDKGKLDIPATVKKLKKWEKEKAWLPYSEMQYKYAPKKLICETFMEDKANGKSLSDYKVYCFHGEPVEILVMNDRGETLKRELFDINWKRLKNPKGKLAPLVETPRPKCLEELLEAARALSAPFPFVRCDFYVVNDRAVFGEMTFTPAAGIRFAYTDVHGKELTDFLHIEQLD